MHPNYLIGCNIQKRYTDFNNLIFPFLLQTRRDFFWDDPFFSNVWDDFEKMRTDIWKGHEDFFSRFNQQEKALQNEAESFMKNSKNESRIMEKSMKKSSSKFEKDFSSSTSDATNSDFGRSRSWLMPKGFFDEDFSKFSDLIPKTLLTPQLKVCIY